MISVIFTLFPHEDSLELFFAVIEDIANRK